MDKHHFLSRSAKASEPQIQVIYIRFLLAQIKSVCLSSTSQCNLSETSQTTLSTVQWETNKSVYMTVKCNGKQLSNNCLRAPGGSLTLSAVSAFLSLWFGGLRLSFIVVVPSQPLTDLSFQLHQQSWQHAVQQGQSIPGAAQTSKCEKERKTKQVQISCK